MVSKEEIEIFSESVGGVIQNLGFLSTSEDLKVASDFMKNTLFEIHIDSKKFKSQTGFARISHKSEFLSEKEVLFNPLSKFKVLEVVKRQRG